MVNHLLETYLTNHTIINWYTLTIFHRTIIQRTNETSYYNKQENSSPLCYLTDTYCDDEKFYNIMCKNVSKRSKQGAPPKFPPE